MLKTRLSFTTVGCVDIDLRVGQCLYDRPSEPFNVTAYVHHATWANLTEIHCEIALSDPHRNYFGAVERVIREVAALAESRGHDASSLRYFGEQ